MTELRNITLATVDPDSGLLDAFGRFRVSEPHTIFDSHQIFDDGDIANSAENFPQFWDQDEISGSGTSTTFSVDRASTKISVSNLTAGNRVRQTKRRMNYQPGKGQLVLLTAVFGAQATGITRTYGLFDDDNGLFVQQDDTGLYAVVRTYVTGSAVDTKVEQANWNVDTLDGNGPSGITLDMSKSQIIWIDFEWLGVGSVRFGFVVNGILYYCHQFRNTNSLANVYMSTPNLPVRAEIDNDGTGAALDFEIICSSVISEGGVEPQGISRSHDNGVTPVVMASTANKYALLGVRLRSSHLGLQLDLTQISILVTTVNDTAHWELHLNPTVGGTFTYSNLSLSGTQVATGAAANTLSADGEILLSGYVKTDQSVQIPARIAEKLGSLIDGTPDELVLVARPVQNNTSALAALNWRELL
jgi:hypothetical protein